MRTLFNERLILPLLGQELEIDSEGRIWRTAARRGVGKGASRLIPCARRRAEHKAPNGYLKLHIMVGGRRRKAYAHRLVWHYFNGPIPQGYDINHKRGVRDDNRPSELELLTRSQNILHCVHVLKTHRSCKNKQVTRKIEQQVFERSTRLTTQQPSNRDFKF